MKNELIADELLERVMRMDYFLSKKLRELDQQRSEAIQVLYSSKTPLETFDELKKAEDELVDICQKLTWQR
jgi:flagellar biosynthesis/type III secretory pathway chaperone